MSFKRFRRIIFRWLLLLLVMAAIAFAGLTGWRLINSYERVVLPDGYDLAVNAKPASGVTNIALFGVDYSDGKASRSDCMMVLSVDADNNAIRLVSLMRDSMVEIDDIGTTKLNHAYSYGGAPLAIRTINQTFDLDIEHYASVDFVQLAQIIDALGGVTVHVQDYEIKETNKFILEYCKTVGIANCPIEAAGEQVLNGAQAMSYARIRKGGLLWGCDTCQEVCPMNTDAVAAADIEYRFSEEEVNWMLTGYPFEKCSEDFRRKATGLGLHNLYYALPRNVRALLTEQGLIK